jgi:hypothetical protein
VAVNDIELNVGVKFDEAEFLDAYQSALSKTSTATQQAVEDGITKLKGSAAPNWNTLPYTTMHDASSGQRTATKAFLASLAHDLNSAGITSKSRGFSAAMTNAAYISSIPDATERFRRLRAEGLYNEAALTAPGSALSSAIESDYTLMQQGWSRNFIKSRKNKAGKKEAYIDFEGMRDYAVDEGLGRWIDEDMPHTADNFELINDELEKIEDKSDKTKKLFTGWNDDLKGVLGTLTAIGGIAGIAKTFEIAYSASESGTIAGAGRLSKQRALIGMTAMDELRTKVASKAVSLGENAIRDEIYGMSDKTQLYKMLGKGDMLPQALLGVFSNLMDSDNPYETYLKSADQLYEVMKGLDDEGKQRYKMLLSQAGLGSMADLIGAFLSNPEYAKEYGSPSALFDLKKNPFYSSYEKAEGMLPSITKTKESLQASYTELYTLWEQAFGGPFRDWWDEVMKNKVVPWFQKILDFIGERSRPSDGAVTELSMILTNNDRNSAIAKAVQKNNALATVPGYKKQTGELGGQSTWGGWFGGTVNQVGKGARSVWDLYGKVADYTGKELEGTSAAETVQRVQYMRKKYYDTGLALFLENKENEDIDKYLLRAMQVGVYGDSETWQANFDAYVDKILGLGTRGETDDRIIELLDTIARNTEISQDLLSNNDFWDLVVRNYGTTVATQWQSSLGRTVNRN